MESSFLKSLRKWIAGFMLLVLLSSTAGWYFTRDTLPLSATLATGETGGVFYSLGQELSYAYQRETGHQLANLRSEGSLTNHQLLLAGNINLAMLQGGTVSTEGLAIIAPLYAELIHVIVRVETGITNVAQLNGRKVVLGRPGSGMRKSALNILAHYELADHIIDVADSYFLDMLTDESLDAAIVTTGILNQDMVKLLRSGRFRLLPLPSATAIAAKDPFLDRSEIPRGLYREGPAIPGTPIETVATTALLATRKDASPKFIMTVLTTLYEGGISEHFPNLIPYHQATTRSPVPLHEVARRYFNPPDQLGLMANILESLAAVKELVLAFIAGGWLLWDRWRRLEADEKQKVMQQQKDHLDSFLARTLSIEEAQMDTTEPDELKHFLDEITRIKLTALKELTDESLRSDQNFFIFLTQCANLINKIQFKIIQNSQSSFTGLDQE